MGRPRRFDQTEALETSTKLFIHKGYDGTSLSDLVQALDIVKPSFYNAFGSKKGLLVQCLEKYSTDSVATFENVLSKETTLQASIEGLFSFVISMHQKQKNNPGCLIATCAAQCDEPDIHDRIKDHHKKIHKLISSRIEQGIKEENLSPNQSAQDLARTIGIFLQGLSVSYRQSNRFKDLAQSTLVMQSLVTEALYPK